MTRADSTPHIGTAGWAVPRAAAEGFPGGGSHLQRYARVFNCAEIDSSFSRSHRTEVYARWAGQTPPGFRFSVKLPRVITHDGRLRGARLVRAIYARHWPGQTRLYRVVAQHY